MKIGVFGANGRVGRLLIELVAAHKDCALSAVFVRSGFGANSPQACLEGTLITNDLERFLQACEVVIDFSLPEATLTLLKAMQSTPKPLVCGTTGLNTEAFALLDSLALKVPVLYATNMSRGVAILNKAIAMVAKSFGDADIEICEIHHRNKKDAPSGTALTLAHTCANARNLDLEKVRVSGRDGDIGARSDDEIAVMSLRGGDVAGRHVVGFYADGEYLEFLHNATSRLTFAKGALDAAIWLKGRAPKRYEIGDLFEAQC